MGMGAGQLASEAGALQAKRFQDRGAAATEAPPIAGEVLESPGQALDSKTRKTMESRFGRDFSRVRIHADAKAASAARAVQARAYTVGPHISFATGEYRPNTATGQRLLAHELTHVVQQQATNGPLTLYRSSYSDPRYTEEQRRAMAEGNVQSTAADVEIANRFGFQPGDIVFRLGSRQLASRIGDPVTHGGIYLGNGIIHDMVGFGNRDVRVSDFYAEAEDPSVVKVIRFTGPLADIIVPRVIENIRARDLDLPTDPVPWNLFSSANDYRTATCLEYSHAQFLYAIREISQETPWAPSVQEELRRTYFRAGAQQPSPLIQPRTLTIGGAMGVAINERRALIAAADYLAEDVDPTVFQNRWEGRGTLRNVGSDLFPTFYQEQSLDTFTYQSFVNATRFFTVVR
ncbi:MAG: DUF4157 domain-containing protein [Anaerolineae bacterium]|jgi:hypothetical protein